jgi:hypothetical protein
MSFPVKILFAIAALVAVGLVVRRYVMPDQSRNGGGTYCTLDAKRCPDGSYVGRVGPKCEFAPCP